MLFIITIALTLCAHSQSSRDSTLLPNDQLRLALQKIEEGKQCAQELQLQKEQNKLLYQRIDVKDSIILKYKTVSETLNHLIDNYKLSESNLESQTELQAKGIKKLERSLKWQKVKTLFTAGAGIVGIGTLAYLFIKK